MLAALALVLAVVAILRVWDLPSRLAALQEELKLRLAQQLKLEAELRQLRDQLAALREATSPPAAPTPAARPGRAPTQAPKPALAPTPPPAAAVPELVATPRPTALPQPFAAPEPVVATTGAAGAAVPAELAVAPLFTPPAAPHRPVPISMPEPTVPTWWERAATLLLENWTGILGAVVLVTGVGFLGIYTALRMAPPYRFLLICAFAVGLLGVRFALREKAFARQLNAWLLSSAAAIFLFACVGAASIPGLRWVSSPYDYLLLLVGVSANLYLAWRTSREAVATLHGVLSLVALAVLPPTTLTLGTAAGVTAFSIAITYRQQWKYQLLLSIASFFAFHLYWHHVLPGLSERQRLSAMGLVLLVGVAAAVVQYRTVYARRRFEPLLFAAHVLNWTCLGINLYLHSTGSIYKTIPLGLGALLTFWAGRRAKQLGIGWLFQTDTIISLILALATALSLQGWHATPTVIGLFMLLESLLVALIMARQSEALVFRVAMAGAGLASVGLLLLAGSHAASSPPPTLYRDALVLAIAGGAGLAFVQLLFKQPLLTFSNELASRGFNLENAALPLANPVLASTELHRQLLGGFAGLAGLLQAGTGLLLARALFGWAGTPVAGLLGALAALASMALGWAFWIHRTGLAPSWVHRQQLVVSQYFAVLALVGLHELGLSWPGVWLVLYTENLLVALLLSGRDEDDLLHTQTYLLVGQALLLPLLVRYASPQTLLSLNGRAALLTAAALLTVAYQLRRHYWPRAQGELASVQLSASYRLPLLGVAGGWLLLGAGALVYTRPWAGWVLVGLLGSLLYLRQRMAAPGVWAGLALAAAGYMGLQWSSPLLWPSPMSTLLDQTGYYTWANGVGFNKLLYLLPTLAVPLIGLATSWWPAAGRYVRWPWLYLLGAHLVVAMAATATMAAYFMLGLLGLAVAAFVAAQQWRRMLPDAIAVARAGQPDRYLLHLAYGLLLGSFAWHLWVLVSFETLFGQPAEYVTATLFFAGLGALAVARPPRTEPVYRSWHVLHRWLPEAALLFGSATLAHHVRAPWLPLLWVSAALTLSYFGPAMPLRLRRLGVYGRLYYWLAALTASADCLLYVSPGYFLRPEWWALTGAVALLFGYVGLALQPGRLGLEGLSPAWSALARPTRRALEAGLLYPAFGALSLLLVQSFDRSVLTVLLMLEVVAIFSSSLLLRRQDLRYVSLAGMLGCLLRLVFFDLSQRGKITQALVFIFMGLLLLGMNALYARFKSRFAPLNSTASGDQTAEEATDETQASLP